MLYEYFKCCDFGHSASAMHSLQYIHFISNMPSITLTETQKSTNRLCSIYPSFCYWLDFGVSDTQKQIVLYILRYDERVSSHLQCSRRVENETN